MPDEKRFPSVEPETKPDGYEVDCPACAGADGKPTGTVVHQGWGNIGTGYSHINQTCIVCWGALKVSRAGLERWRVQTGG